MVLERVDRQQPGVGACSISGVQAAGSRTRPRRAAAWTPARSSRRRRCAGRGAGRPALLDPVLDALSARRDHGEGPAGSAGVEKPDLTGELDVVLITTYRS